MVGLITPIHKAASANLLLVMRVIIVSYLSSQSSVVSKLYDWCVFMLTSTVRSVQRKQKLRKLYPLGGTCICILCFRLLNISTNPQSQKLWSVGQVVYYP